ncbi:MAG TPA: hypothetical protein VJ743_10525 [Albitalea sp.]|nr:hypothetical protein [Albitalea sp.]
MSRRSRRELALQRELLVLRCDLQRLQLHRDLVMLSQALSPAAWTARAWDGLRAHPSRWLLPVAALFALRRTPLRGALAAGLALWRSWRRMERWAAR